MYVINILYWNYKNIYEIKVLKVLVCKFFYVIKES